MHRGRPWANYFLIVINIAIFFWQLRNPSLLARYQLNGRALSVWQFVSYAFLHVGWGHLIFNMVVLYLLGHEINVRLGRSEERRVGKECRCRWARYDYKKKSFLVWDLPELKD